MLEAVESSTRQTKAECVRLLFHCTTHRVGQSQGAGCPTDMRKSMAHWQGEGLENRNHRRHPVKLV